MNKHSKCKQQVSINFFSSKVHLCWLCLQTKYMVFFFSDSFTKLTALLCVKAWGLDLIKTIVFCCIYHKLSYIWALTLHTVFFLLSPVMCVCLRLERVSLVSLHTPDHQLAQWFLSGWKRSGPKWGGPWHHYIGACCCWGTQLRSLKVQFKPWTLYHTRVLRVALPCLALKLLYQNSS